MKTFKGDGFRVIRCVALLTLSKLCALCTVYSSTLIIQSQMPSTHFAAYAASRAPVWGTQGLVATISPLASQTGASILRQGGNAADAAVAVGFALAVTWPAAGNLGGGGFALVRKPDGARSFLDYREVAPAAAGEKFYLDAKDQVIPESSTIGYRAVGVPGSIAGFALLHKKYGKLPWKTLLEPARLLAEKGFIVDEDFITIMNDHKDLLGRFPDSVRIFLNGGKFFKVGDRIVQKDLAQTLKELQTHGPEAFYNGKLGQRFSQAIKKNGGVITPEDLSNYKPVEREPLRGRFKNFEILTAPPPSTGGALLVTMLQMLENDDLKNLGFGSAAYNHLLIETMKQAFADRAQWYGDPAFADVPLSQLLDPEYIKARRQKIDLQKATPSATVRAGTFNTNESTETTHYTIIDSSGMIVSNTYTLNGSFGSGATAEGTGILLNNEMDDFTVKTGEPNMFGLIQNERNSIAPGKRPLSSMTPTIILENDKPILALGSPGGPTIINSVLQVTLNVLVHGMDIQAAVDAPKLHHQWLPDSIRHETYGINPDTRRIMEGMGHLFNEKASTFGDVQAVYFDRTRNQWSGASDSRHGGLVAAE